MRTGQLAHQQNRLFFWRWVKVPDIWFETSKIYKYISCSCINWKGWNQSGAIWKLSRLTIFVQKNPKSGNEEKCARKWLFLFLSRGNGEMTAVVVVGRAELRADYRLNIQFLHHTVLLVSYHNISKYTQYQRSNIRHKGCYSMITWNC